MKILAKQTRIIPKVLSLDLYGFKIIRRKATLYLSASQNLHTEHVSKDFK
jgi:hypothetical protein